MSSKIVSIVIVAAGKKDYFKSLLDSLREQTYHFFEVIVIDNSLNYDFSFGLIRDYPEVKLFSSSKNLFYCQALNKGIEMSKGDFILCLNDDVILDKRFIEEALRGFQIRENIGMVSGKILRGDRKTLDSTGLFLSAYRSARERGYGIKDRGQFDKEGCIFGVNGAVGFYRKKMLEDIKLSGEYFDSDFSFFYEDLDLAWRAHNLGWKGYYIPRAVAYHLRGGTARSGRGINKKFARIYLNNELHFNLIKNRYLTIIKNENLLDLLILFPLVIFYDIFVWGYILFFRFKVLNLFFSKGIPINSAFRKRIILKKMKNTAFKKPVQRLK